MKPSAHVLHFTGWSASELRRIQHGDARVPLAKWQVAKNRWHIEILVEAQVFFDRAGFRPDGYELRRMGEVIETGELAWVPRLHVTAVKRPTNQQKEDSA